MNRRTALAAVATGFGATAGCLDLLPSRPSGGERPGDAQNPSSDGGSSGAGNENDGQNGAGQSLAAVGACPSLPIEGTTINQLVCDGEDTDTEVYLSANRDAVSLPNGSLAFTFLNGSTSDMLYAACRWAVYKQSNGGWETVRPLNGETSTSILKSGSTQATTLTLYVGRDSPSGAEPCGYSLDGLDAGRYMFGVEGTAPEAGKTLFLASFRAEN